jgi:hypothetical protein
MFVPSPTLLDFPPLLSTCYIIKYTTRIHDTIQQLIFSNEYNYNKRHHTYPWALLFQNLSSTRFFVFQKCHVGQTTIALKSKKRDLVIPLIGACKSGENSSPWIKPEPGIASKICNSYSLQNSPSSRYHLYLHVHVLPYSPNLIYALTTTTYPILVI